MSFFAKTARCGVNSELHGGKRLFYSVAPLLSEMHLALPFGGQSAGGCLCLKTKRSYHKLIETLKVKPYLFV